MKVSWIELISNLVGRELTPEEEKQLVEAHKKALESLSFEDVASSVREKYPNATEEDLERVITMKGAGYKINYGELPPQPFKERLEAYLRCDIERVKIMSERSPRTCEVCREADGKVYTTEEALEKMPLPHEDCECESRAFKEEGVCHCDYLPESSLGDPDPSLYPDPDPPNQ